MAFSCTCPLTHAACAVCSMVVHILAKPHRDLARRTSSKVCNGEGSQRRAWYYHSVEVDFYFAVWPALPQKYLHISAGSFPNSKNRPFAEIDFCTCVAGDRYVDLLPGTEITVESVYVGMVPLSFAKAKFEIWAFLGRWLPVFCPSMYLRRN